MHRLDAILGRTQGQEMLGCRFVEFAWRLEHAVKKCAHKVVQKIALTIGQQKMFLGQRKNVDFVHAFVAHRTYIVQ